MPELPDIETYVEALRERVLGQPLEAMRLKSPFLLRTVDPPVSAAAGARAVAVERLGKRIALVLENDVRIVLHLMIAGRLQWRPRGAKLGLAQWDFPTGTLALTEAGSRHRASVHLVRGEAAMRALAPPAVEPLAATRDTFLAALRSENRTLKRALTDPRLVSGIGNAYSDEILHQARMSPVTLTSRLDDEDGARLFDATREVLAAFTQRLRAERKGRWPAKVTAFREDFAVHGRFGEACPVCQTAVQRIVRGEHETNYCPRCQTDGKMLADRALSKLLHDDWPKTVEEWEERMPARTGARHER